MQNYSLMKYLFGFVIFIILILINYNFIIIILKCQIFIIGKMQILIFSFIYLLYNFYNFN